MGCLNFIFAYNGLQPYAGCFSQLALRLTPSHHKKQKELQFKGLCAVIEYLAELDGIPNPFNFDNLFNDDKEKSNLELELILN